MRFLALLFVIVVLASQGAFGQKMDTVLLTGRQREVTQVFLLDSQHVAYPKPKFYTFVTSIPATFRGVAKESFKKKNAGPWAMIAGTSLALWLGDQQISNRVQQFSRFIHLDNSRQYVDVAQFTLGNTKVSVYQAPDNLNTAIYSVGEGMPWVFLSAGLAVHGLIKKNNRSLSTASQIMQGTIAMGITTQFMKRLTGRQSPFAATDNRGIWHPLVSPKKYQQNISGYDAFPSGHMATMMTTATILAENYPEKRWIRPVCYSVMTIVGLSMINNGVHWASDYPLAIGMGYVFGKVTVGLNRWVKGEKKTR